MTFNESLDGASSDVAVVGMACRYAGARNKEQFWDNLSNGRDTITYLSEDDVTADRHLYHNPHYVNATGLLPDYDRFDPELFGVSERMAAFMTPEHRVFLECAWDAMMDGGYDGTRFQGDVAVYAACNAQSIARYSPAPDWVSGADGVLEHSQGWCPDTLSAYTLYHLGLTGEAMTLMALCSGFHSAVHLACQSLLLGQSDMALAGGVLVRLPHERGYLWEAEKPMSRDGHCRSYDAKGTGAAIASGVCSFLLKPAHAAIRDRDHIYGLIKGTAINNNGARSIGFGLIQPERLGSCIAAAIAAAGVSPDSIAMLEGVGAGLPSSDALEFRALRLGFDSKLKRRCSLGSAKSNIGHAGVASGGASAMKALLAIYNKVIPASINFDSPNPEMNCEDSPFFIQRETAAWHADGIRRAGVNSIGGAGFNAHMVLEEAPALPERPACEVVPRLVMVSAHSAAALAEQRQALRAWLGERPGLRLDDVCYTLNVGRKDLKHRWSSVVSTREELLAVLAGADAGAVPSFEHVLDGQRSALDPALFSAGPNGVFVSQPGQLAEPRSLAALAAAWVGGHQLDRDRLYEGTKHHRVSLPGYSFQRRRFWSSK